MPLLSAELSRAALKKLEFEGAEPSRISKRRCWIKLVEVDRSLMEVNEDFVEDFD